MYLKKFFPYLLLSILTLSAWINYIDLNLLSEDHLVLSFHDSTEVSELFEVFTQQNVDGDYWRPITYLSYRVIESVDSQNIALHRSVSLALYLALVLLFYLFLLKIEIDQITALLISALFSVLYNHEYQLGWIPGRTDLLMGIFIILASISILNYFQKSKLHYLLYSVLFFSISLLSKEHAFIGVIIPLVLAISFNFKEKRKVIFASFLFLASALFIFLYRILIIGGNPFASGNFSSINIAEMLRNFFAYLSLVFFRPEEIEQMLYFAKYDFFFLIPMLILLFLAIILIMKRLKNNVNINLIIFGSIWFMIFIIPALPTLMRWYVFLPSIGIFIIMAALFNGKLNQFTIISFVIVIFMNIIVSNIRYKDWQVASYKTSHIIENLNGTDDPNKKIIFWGLPDKYERVNMLKIAPDVMISDKINVNKDNIFTPIKCEYYKNSIFKQSINNGILNLKLINGRYFIRGTKSSSIPKKETYIDSLNNYQIIINNDFFNDIFISNAYIRLNNSDSITNIFFNGKKTENITTINIQ